MRKTSLLTILLFIVTTGIFSQKQKRSEETKPAPAINYDSVFQALKWRNIGPFRGGRANAICGVPGNEQTFFVGYS